VIPQDWESRRIDTVCRLINGRGFKPFEWQNTGLPIIRIQNLNGSDDFNFYTGAYDTKLEVEPGQLLFAWSGSRGTSFGPHIWHGPLGLLNYHTWKVQVHETEIRKEFLLHALRRLTTFIEGKAHGASALVHTQKWEMEGFQFPLPPTKAEQEAIAEALSDVDKLLGSLEKLIAKKRAIKQAAMQQLLTGKTRLPGFSEAWEPGRLADFGVFRSGNGFPLAFQGRQSGDYPFFKVSDLNSKGNELLLKNANHWISEEVRRALGATKFSAGSIVFAKIGAAIFLERKRLLSRESCLDNNMMAFSLTVPEACEHFLHYLFLRMELGKLVSTTALPSLSGREIGAISVPLPPPDEQRAIATVLSDMDADIAVLEQRRDKTRAIKQGMMQQLLTGRVRLVRPPRITEASGC